MDINYTGILLNRTSKNIVVPDERYLKSISRIEETDSPAVSDLAALSLYVRTKSWKLESHDLTSSERDEIFQEVVQTAEKWQKLWVGKELFAGSIVKGVEVSWALGRPAITLATSGGDEGFSQGEVLCLGTVGFGYSENTNIETPVTGYLTAVENTPVVMAVFGTKDSKVTLAYPIDLLYMMPTTDWASEISRRLEVLGFIG